MIVYPESWRRLGVPVAHGEIDCAIREAVRDIDCFNLSFSGGIDSSLLLYYLLNIKGKAKVFTIANDPDHPDIKYSQKVIDYFQDRYKIGITHHTFIRPGLEGDELVRSFYISLACLSVDSIITGDCIDELACGYYQHQDLSEETYHDYLDRLQTAHLEPLNENSGDIKVYMPYADDRVVNLLHRVPLYRKVDSLNRKLVMMSLAKGKIPDEIIERKKYGLGTSINKVKV